MVWHNSTTWSWSTSWMLPIAGIRNIFNNNLPLTLKSFLRYCKWHRAFGWVSQRSWSCTTTTNSVSAAEQLTNRQLLQISKQNNAKTLRHFSSALEMPEYFSFWTFYSLDICHSGIKFEERWPFLLWPYKTLSVLTPMCLKLERIMRSHSI